MTLRNTLAMEAMKVIMANEPNLSAMKPDTIAQCAFRQADAMLKLAHDGNAAHTLADAVLRLNPASNEIGAGKLAMLQELARAVSIRD